MAMTRTGADHGGLSYHETKLASGQPDPSEYHTHESGQGTIIPHRLNRQAIKINIRDVDEKGEPIEQSKPEKPQVEQAVSCKTDIQALWDQTIGAREPEKRASDESQMESTSQQPEKEDLAQEAQETPRQLKKESVESSALYREIHNQREFLRQSLELIVNLLQDLQRSTSSTVEESSDSLKSSQTIELNTQPIRIIDSKGLKLRTEVELVSVDNNLLTLFFDSEKSYLILPKSDNQVTIELKDRVIRATPSGLDWMIKDKSGRELAVVIMTLIDVEVE